MHKHEQYYFLFLYTTKNNNISHRFIFHLNIEKNNLCP